jgi:hypothetical protein
VAEPKTKATGASVSRFLGAIVDEEKRRDSRAIAKMMESATRSKPKMLGSNIVGFGERTITYADGRESAWPLIAFSPRKANLTLYVGRRFDGRDSLLKKLGKHSTGGGCLYVKRLSHVDLPTLKKIVAASVKHARKGA